MQWALNIYHVEHWGAAGQHRKKKMNLKLIYVEGLYKLLTSRLCGPNLMTNTDERVHYVFYRSLTIRPQTLSLHLIQLDGKLIKVFTIQSAQQEVKIRPSI